MIRGLDKRVKSKGVACSIRTDGGRHFDNSMLSSWLDARHVNHQFSLPHDHMINGLIERCNRIIF